MHEVFFCPVCGENITHQLPSIESIFEEEFRFSENFCLTDSVVMGRLTFYHERDDEFLPLEDPHKLTAVIRMVFDSEGACTAFNVVGLYSASGSPDRLWVSDVKEVTL